MYLVFALLAPIVMFGLIPGLAWFEERMLGPGFSGPRSTPERTPAPPTAKPTAVSTADAAADTAPPTTADPADTAPLPPPIPLQPVTSSALPVAAPIPASKSTAPIRHHVRHTLKRGRGLRAA